jgi:hypothetical protein
MRTFICIHDVHRGGNLNVRQLLNPIFFEHTTRHPDHKRQRGMRTRARSLRQARELKTTQSTWVPKLPETHAWEKWYAERGWTCKEPYGLGRPV